MSSETPTTSDLEIAPFAVIYGVLAPGILGEHPGAAQAVTDEILEALEARGFRIVKAAEQIDQSRYYWTKLIEHAQTVLEDAENHLAYWQAAAAAESRKNSRTD